MAVRVDRPFEFLPPLRAPVLNDLLLRSRFALGFLFFLLLR